MSNSLKVIAGGATPLPTDVNQLAEGLTGQADIGALSLFPPVSDPAAPSVAVNTAAGNLTGNYQYVAVLVTGWKASDGTVYVRGFAPGAASAVVSPSAEQVNISSIPTGPADPTNQYGTVARILYRTQSGGAVYYFLAAIADNTTTAWTDNTPDSSLGTGMPTPSSSPAWYGASVPSQLPSSNTTGTSFAVSIGATAPANPANGALWINTGGATPLLEFYDNGWVVASPPPHVADAQETLLTTTNATTVATYTPTAQANYVARVYFRVVTATTTVTVKVTYADAGGAQTDTVLNAQSCAVGSYSTLPVYFNAVSGTAIAVVVTAGTASQVYVSADISQA